jgi:hypothetical protein
MILGFTGTRKVMTDRQKDSLRKILIEMQPAEFHHGDSIGADSQAHAIVRAHTKARIIIHPPNKDRYRAFCEGDKTRPVKEYISRNHDIVAECDMMVAAPGATPEELRSGTLATVRYARQKHMIVTVLEP